MAQGNGEIKPTLHWAEQKLRVLSEQAFTGTVTIRFAQGGVQSLVLNQELHPRQDLHVDVQAISTAGLLRKA